MMWQDRIYIAFMGLAISTIIDNILGTLLFWTSAGILMLHLIIFFIALQLTIKNANKEKSSPDAMIKKLTKKTR